MKIEIDNLKKHFGKTKAVDGISFSFESGDVFGFVGPNGAGKTTTLRILATLDEVTDGDARVDGKSITQYPETVRRFVGFVPDALPSHRDITVHEYLDVFARAYGLDGSNRKRAVEGVEEFTKLTSFRHKTLNQLSKGMKQRVSFGRALVHDPSVLIMDEPAAGLDPRARIELRELVLALARQKKAILISSHILTELAEMCNGVVIIEKGKLLQSGTIEDVSKQNTPFRTVAIRVLEKRHELFKDILQMPFVEAAREEAQEIFVEFKGDDAAGSQMLVELINRGYRIAEFRHMKKTLEEMFMSITRGEIA